MSVCLCVFVSKIILNNASNRVVMAFTDIILNENYQHNRQIGMVLYLIQVKVVLFAIISGTS